MARLHLHKEHHRLVVVALPQTHHDAVLHACSRTHATRHNRAHSNEQGRGLTVAAAARIENRRRSRHLEWRRRQRSNQPCPDARLTAQTANPSSRPTGTTGRRAKSTSRVQSGVAAAVDEEATALRPAPHKGSLAVSSASQRAKANSRNWFARASKQRAHRSAKSPCVQMCASCAYRAKYAL